LNMQNDNTQCLPQLGNAKLADVTSINNRINSLFDSSNSLEQLLAKVGAVLQLINETEHHISASRGIYCLYELSPRVNHDSTTKTHEDYGGT